MDNRRRQPSTERTRMQNVRIPGYAVLKTLGGGGQANVYKAARMREGDVRESDDVAVKVFHGAHGKQALRSELHFLVTLQGHANILRLVESFGADANVDALVLELCATDLYALSNARNLSEIDVVNIMRGAASALEHMHAFKIVHRDVKPENLAIAGDGSVRLMDFGLSAYLVDTHAMTTHCGSLPYTAPEVLAKDSFGLPVDMFGFGATMYFILGKRYPLVTPDMSCETALEKSRNYSIVFGSSFAHVGKDSMSLIRWLMHPCETWRPDASFVLRCPPFAYCFHKRLSRKHTLSFFEAQLPSRVDVGMHSNPPFDAREGIARMSAASSSQDLRRAMLAKIRQSCVLDAMFQTSQAFESTI
eukprot:TRINITY_DN8202_c0_g1_i1.p1 TRINITY_DN8202_c0_g1~~TRINITY_DN8202_c0_g1_i1.p1  ORF type:complete len:361 (-),score=40.20 TRINITY_DN8202_c0_g1_i1:475-1557(-)